MFSLERAGSNEDVNIVAQLGRLPYNPGSINVTDYQAGHIPIDKDWSGVRRYYVIKNEHPELNSKFENILLEDLLNIKKIIPKNPILEYYIGEEYWRKGESEKSKKYFTMSSNHLTELVKN
jgi:hypothetical protein